MKTKITTGAKSVYQKYHGTPKAIHQRSLRNQARKKLGLKKGDPREVDHKKPLSKGGTNDRRNLRAVSRKVNRSKGDKPMKSKPKRS